MKILLIADDLTGALDSGVALAKNGLKSVIELNGEKCDADVVIIDSSSRHINPEKAYEKIFNIVKENGSANLVYKKTDSVLRGNIGAELAAVMDAMDEKQLWFIPAYPRNGRTTIRGVQYVNGVDIANSSFGKDPFNPVKFSAVGEIIKEQTDKNVINLSADFYMCENDVPAIFVVDAETDEDLKKISEKLFKKERVRCVAGCGGFASYLPVCREENKIDDYLDVSEGLIVVSGSVTPITRNQILYAQRNGVNTVVLNEKQKNGEFIEQVDFSSNTIVFAAADSSSEYNANISPEKVSDVLADAACKALKMMPKAAICIFGGDTLRAVLKKLGIDKIYPICEIEKGVVVSQISTKNLSYRLISKSGGFGSDDIIDKIRNYPKILPRK